MTRKTPTEKKPKPRQGAYDGSKMTSLMRTEQEARASDERYRALLSNMLCGFAHCRMVYDERDRPVDFVYLTVNEAFGRLTGLTDVVGKAVSEVIPGIREQSRELFAACDRVTSTGVPETFEFDFTSQGKWLCIAVYRPEKGEFVAVLDDITERKRADVALRTSETSLAQSQRIAHLGSWMLDLETDELTWSDELYRIFGVSADVLVPGISALIALIHPDDRSAMGAWIDATLSQAKLGPLEFRVIRPDGTIRVIEGDGELQVDAANKPIRMIGTAQDITERTQIAESETRLAAIVEATPDLVSIAGQDGQLLYVNRAGRRMLGLDELGDLTAHNLGQFHDAANARVVTEEAIPTAMREGSWRGDTVLRALDGHAIPVSQVVLAHMRSDGTPAFLSTLARDNTARRREEENLRRMATLVRDSNDAITIQDFEGRITAWNRGAELMYGYGEEEALALNIERLTTPGKVEEQKDFIRRLIAGEAITSFETRRVTKDGRVLDVWMTVTKLMDDAGTPVGLASTERDITERKRAEEALRLQAAALSAAADAIMITDRGGTIEWVNPAFTQLAGYSTEEAVGRNPRDLVKSGKEDPAVYKELWETILDGGAWHGEIINRRKDGSLYTEAQTVTPIRDAAGAITHFVAIKEDVTERQRLQAQYLQAQKMESVGRLAGGVAHDFNNLLAVILGWTGIALSDLPLDHPVRPSLEEVLRAGEGAAVLTKQLLAFSRQNVVQPLVFNINTLVVEMDKMLLRLIGEDVQVVLRTDPELDTVKMDRGQLEQVLLNLVVNARDAMPTGGILTIETTNVVLDATYPRRDADVAPGDYVVLAVSDSGIGMSEKVAAHVFEPFFTTKAPGKGTGLGLSTSYGIVKQAGGRITVYSQEGLGTTMKVYLPRCHDTADAATPGEEWAPQHGGETLLVVEDDAAVSRVTVYMLEKQGYRVVTASTGSEALQVISEAREPLHLLLTDVVLGAGMSGPVLADRARTLRPDLKVLFVSGYAGDVTTRHGLQQSGIPLLQKPFNAEALGRKVLEVLDAQ